MEEEQCIKGAASHYRHVDVSKSQMKFCFRHRLLYPLQSKRMLKCESAWQLCPSRRSEAKRGGMGT